MIAVAFIVKKDTLLKLTFDQEGIIYGGSFEFLLVQMGSVLVIGLWSAMATLLTLIGINLVTNIRLTPGDESKGADLVEHKFSFDSNDDTLLPQSNKNNSRSFARQRMKRVLTALRATHRLSSNIASNDAVRRRVKKNQTKTLATSWPENTSPSVFPA